nr:hypothetical protein [uncultured Desulfobacter sp.]
MDEKTMNEPVAEILQKNLEFHEKWRMRISIAHTLTSIGMIVFSAGAAFIGTFYGTTAAFFAAIATICASLEKGLKLSEKWKLHLKTQMKLESIKLRYEKKQFAQESEIIKEISDVMNSYATELQVEDAVVMDSLREEFKTSIEEIKTLKNEIKTLKSSIPGDG